MFGGLSVTEILVVLVIALIIFGPRKLPELGKSLGQSLAQFRKASEDFKRTWETEVTLEEKKVAEKTPAPMTPEVNPHEEDLATAEAEGPPPPEASAPAAPSVAPTKEETGQGSDGHLSQPTI
jgi:TatA/E family protein of Tat protein translocase